MNALLACSGDDGGQDASGASDWQLVFEGLDGALISVAGTAADDVWTVGANPGDGEGAVALHFDGNAWTRVPTGTESNLWWVHVLSSSSLFAGGEGGTIVRYADGAFTEMQTPGSSTVYGIWGTDEDDLWAVGGDPDVSPGFVWRFDGDAWRDVTAELPAESQGPVLFKVWGRAADDLWLVGMDGVAVHWDGAAFAAGDTGTDQRLFTVNGTDGDDPAFVAVGGFGRATILEHDGTSWHDVTPVTGLDEPAIAQLFGVAMRGSDDGFAVGYDGTVLQRKVGGWSRVDLGFEVFQHFHAVWIDPSGGAWAVGGDVLTPSLDEGMLVHQGPEISNAIER